MPASCAPRSDARRIPARRDGTGAEKRACVYDRRNSGIVMRRLNSTRMTPADSARMDMATLPRHAVDLRTASSLRDRTLNPAFLDGGRVSCLPQPRPSHEQPGATRQEPEAPRTHSWCSSRACSPPRVSARLVLPREPSPIVWSANPRLISRIGSVLSWPQFGRHAPACRRSLPAA